MPKNNCGKEPSPAFQRAAWLRWKQCKSGIEVDPSFGERPTRNKTKKKGPTFE